MMSLSVHAPVGAGYLHKSTDSRLPAEVLLAILEYTTPATFIAFSQASRYFRELTMPDRHHFLMRLLELELILEHGGAVPEVDQHGVPKPSLEDSKSWDDTNTRYACSVCLKLRFHRNFDNRSVLRMRLRKPPPDAPAATIFAEPGDVRERQRRRQRVEGSRRTRLQQKQPAPSTPTRRCNDQHLSKEDEDRYRQYILQKTGTERHRRTCADCVIKLGRGLTTTCDHGAIPIAFPIMQSRWSAGFAPNSIKHATDKAKRVGHQVVKCQSCGHWKPVLGYSPQVVTYSSSWYWRNQNPQTPWTIICWQCRHHDAAHMSDELAKVCRHNSKAGSFNREPPVGPSLDR